MVYIALPYNGWLNKIDTFVQGLPGQIRLLVHLSVCVYAGEHSNLFICSFKGE